MDNIGGRGNDRDGMGAKLPATRWETLTPPAVLVHAAMFTSVVILSVGLVLALLLFIYLSFQKPDAATLLVPLILGPVGLLVVNNAKKLAEEYLQRRASESGERPAIDEAQSPGELIERMGELAIDCKHSESERHGEPVELVRGSGDGSGGDIAHIPADPRDGK